MQRSAWKDIVSWRIKRRNNHTKSQRHGGMIINLKKKKKLDQLENCQQFAHIFSEMFFWALSGGPDISWSVNKLARAVT